MIYNNLSIEHYEKYKQLVDSSVTKEYFIKFVNNVLNENHKIFVIEDPEKNIIGSGTVFIEEKLTYSGCKMGHIENILIGEKYRSLGYGEKLVNYLLEICKNKGCYRVDLNCSSELQHFYQKNGFTKKHICMNIYFKENFN